MTNLPSAWLDKSFPALIERSLAWSHAKKLFLSTLKKRTWYCIAHFVTFTWRKLLHGSKIGGRVRRNTFMDQTMAMIQRAIALSLLAMAAPANGQFAPQVTLATPLHSISDSFFENTGVNFGFRHDTPTSRMFFNNGLGQAIPAFGGFDPGAQSSFGLQGRRGNWSWNLGLTGGQGSSRRSVTTTPILTLPNGGFGFINDTINRPFVTGIIPVVGSRVVAEQAEANRQRFRQQFDQAASIVKEKRRVQAEQRAYELAKLKEQSEARSAAKKRKLNQPLVLGRKKTPTANERN